MVNFEGIFMRLSSQNLIKQYGSKRVVNDVSVEVNTGEIVGLLGPNGAGKTTTFYMFVGLEAYLPSTTKCQK
jgi:lipopolysaccharide export system ATP-binding protein